MPQLGGAITVPTAMACGTLENRGATMLITRFLQDFIQAGALTLITAEGRTHKFDGPEQGPHITLRLHKRSLEWTLVDTTKQMKKLYSAQ